MASNNSFDLVSLDFSLLKASFRSFLQNNPIFKDYNYEGSAMNVLLDVLTYNTFKNAFFLNMTFAEGFMDTAQLRESIVSHAKDLNYVPRSARSPEAVINVSFTATGESQPYIIPKGSTFSTLIKNQSFTYTVPETLIVSSVNSTFTFQTSIYEGPYFKDAYIFKTPGNDSIPRFQLSNPNVDTSSMTVTVFEDGAQVGTNFILSPTLLDINEFSKVYFLQAAENGYYEVLFGDSNLGYKPKENSLIEIDYRVTRGDASNGARVFFPNFVMTGTVNEITSGPTIDTFQAAINGAGPESVESIRYTAPRHFQAQERCIVPADYETLLQENFPEIGAVAAYGGEDAKPIPMYGRVFVAIDIKNTTGIPDSRRTVYTNFLRARSPMIPIIIEPNFTFVAIDTIVRYNQNVTVNTPTVTNTLVRNAIAAYDIDNLHKFGIQFRYSPFCSMIDDTDPSILSNITKVNIYKKISPIFGDILDLVLTFGIPLQASFGSVPDTHDTTEFTAINSDPFIFQGSQCQLQDDGLGTIHVVSRIGDSFFVVLDQAGTVDYEQGIVTLRNFSIDSYSGTSINVFATPADPDILFPRDTIAEIEAGQTKVTVQAILA